MLLSHFWLLTDLIVLIIFFEFFQLKITFVTTEIKCALTGNNAGYFTESYSEFYLAYKLLILRVF